MTVFNAERLKELASAYDIATSYWDYTGQYREVSETTILGILQAMGLELRDDKDVETALQEHDEAPWRKFVPDCLVTRQDQTGYVWIHVPHGEQVYAEAHFEDGTSQALTQADHYFEPRMIDGHLVGRATFIIDAGLPLGWHRIVVKTAGGQIGECPLAITPGKMNNLVLRGRKWGLMAQLYSVRSHRSWGIGDTVDLANLAALGAAHGADFCLINPVHAAGPFLPITPSPYLPGTRRFVSPQYIRPEAIDEAAYLSPHKRRVVAALAKSAFDPHETLLDRSRAWKHRLVALELIFQVPRDIARQADFEEFCAREGQDLEDYALWCALVEKLGPDLPEEYRTVDAPGVAEARKNLAERIEFYRWTQWVVQDQFKRAQRQARERGMDIGIMHDLAVGIAPFGSDLFSHPEWFARGVTVGAPADMYNQLGQNWAQPPWLPHKLAECAYQPLRDMARTVTSLGGAVRLDHVIGLFRLWWIPSTASSPAEGTYVRYNHEAMVGIVMLEAHRNGAVIIGEDLGTVEDWVRDYLDERGILGTSVAWFERDTSGLPKAPEDYRELALATVNTHDLPPTAGFLREAHIDLGEKLGLFDTPVEQMRAIARAEREQMVDRLRSRGLVGESPSEQDIIEALHRYVCRTPSRLVAATLVDAVGEIRMQNQPGTDQEYPNWRIPLGDGDGKVVWLEDLPGNPRLQSLMEVMREERPRG